MKNILCFVMFAGVLIACSSGEQASEQAPKVQAKAEASINVSQIDQLAESYFEAVLELDPFYAPAWGDYRFNQHFGNNLTDNYLANSKQLVKQHLEMLRQIDRNRLSSNAQVTYDVLQWTLERKIAAFVFPDHLMPFNQFNSRLNAFANMGSGLGAQPFKAEEDYMAFALKMEEMVVWVDTSISRMQEGIEKNIVLPHALVEKMLPQIKVHIVENPEAGIYWGPIRNMSIDLKAQQSASLSEVYRNTIKDRIVPAYQRLYAFLKDVYLPKARSTSGYAALPNGVAWYAESLKVHTTTDMSADDIYKLGLEEVARILREMNTVRETVEFKGDFKAFLKFMAEDPQFYFSSSEEVVQAYQNIRSKIDAVIPAYFDIKPRMDYEIRPVEVYRAASAAGAYYEPGSPDGNRPGVFYINTHNLKAQPRFITETLSIHEAVPGHHFQNAIQIELENLPRIRRFGGNTAFEEGWALYAESLGKEMGLFTDPYQYYGRLSDELLRAMRLIVDTGLHAKNWTREQAISYMLENSSMAESDVTAEVERYMAMPGQATAYKVGELKIRQLRSEAESQLGERFNIKAFHRQVLESGNIPLSVLENKIHKWIVDEKAR